MLVALLKLLLPITATVVAAALGSRPPVQEAADELLDAKEAAALLKVSVDHCYRSKELQGCRIKLGGRVLFNRKALASFIARRTGR